MNFEQWKEADSTTRRRFEGDCYAQQTPRKIGQLAEEAAVLLSKMLSGVPAVLAVRAGEDTKARHSVLLVTTSEDSNESVQGVPKEYIGFPVVQVGIRKRKALYLMQLKVAFRASGVRESEADWWLNHFDKKLNDVGSVYYLESSGRWISETLMGALVKDRLTGRRRVELRQEVSGMLIDFFLKNDTKQIIECEQEIVSRLSVILKGIFAAHGIDL